MTTETEYGFSDRVEDSGRKDRGSSSMVPSNYSDWADAVPKRVTAADSLSEKRSAEVWNLIYTSAGMRTANEKERKAVRAAIYVHCALNGTSREGEWGDVITLSNGTDIEAAIVPRSAGKMNCRKFMRANMIESYEFFKTTRVMESYPRFVAKAATYGIAPDCAFAMADWLDDCSLFSPAELRAHDTVFAKSIERARRARGGQTLESVENGRIDATIQANGPAGGQNGVITSDW